VPFWSALLLGVGFTGLSWLIWLEMLPRGLLLSFELPFDKDFRGTSFVPAFLVILLAVVAAMAFVAMFFPEITQAFSLLWLRFSAEGPGAAAGALLDTLRETGVLLPLAVATAARVWRAWWIDVRRDPAMAHVRFDTRERRTRRMFAFGALMLWIAGLSRLSALESFGPRFFASLAAFVYCFLPFVVAKGETLRRRFSRATEE